MRPNHKTIFPCWKSVNSRRAILLMVLVTLSILVYEWQWQCHDTRVRLEQITLTLTGPIIPSANNAVPKISPVPVESVLSETERTETKKFVPFSYLPSFISNGSLEFKLNIRRLNVFAVHEMNKISKSSDIYSSQCVKWWSNPLTVQSVGIVNDTEEYSDLSLSYVVHPGHFNFIVQIRQRQPPVALEDNDLEIITPFKSTIPLPNQYCLGKEASEELTSVCQCGSSEDGDVAALESETLKERIQWNLSDPELITWRLHKSFSVDDYLNFTNYETFISSPGKANETIRATYCLPKTKLLLMVSSAPNHFLNRKAIRNTYGSPENLDAKGIKLVFMMGTIDENQKDLEEEIKTYDDIIIETYVDSYHNLTLSHLAMYKWTYLTCSQMGLDMPTHVLKADDDFFINVDLALALIEKNPTAEYMYKGCLYCGTKPIRDFQHYMTKYYTPLYMYLPDTYVGYLSGVTYIFNTNIIPRVLKTSLSTPIIHMDDTYMTGLIARQLKIYPHNSPLITYARVEQDTCKLKKTVSSAITNVDDLLLQWKTFTEPADCDLDYVDYALQTLDETQKRDCYFT